MKLGEIILDHKNGPDWAVIYIVKNGNTVLYVGKSNNNVEFRLAQHLGHADPPSSGAFSEAARSAMPDCWNWDVEFVVVPDDILNNGHQIDYWIKQTEARLVRELQPQYNNHYKYK